VCIHAPLEDHNSVKLQFCPKKIGGQFVLGYFCCCLICNVLLIAGKDGGLQVVDVTAGPSPESKISVTVNGHVGSGQQGICS
jgi:hypothetical protein